MTRATHGAKCCFLLVIALDTSLKQLSAVPVSETTAPLGTSLLNVNVLQFAALVPSTKTHLIALDWKTNKFSTFRPAMMCYSLVLPDMLGHISHCILTPWFTSSMPSKIFSTKDMGLSLVTSPSQKTELFHRLTC